MVKSQKVKRANHRIPFYKEIIDENVAKPTTRRKKQNRRETHEETVIDNKLTQKILTEAVKQLEDIEEEVGLSSLCDNLQTSHLYAGLSDEKNACVESREKKFQQEDFQDETEFNSMPKDKKAPFIDEIKEALAEKRTEINTLFSVARSPRKVDEKTLSLCKDLAKVLSTYRSGKIPKYFKFLPNNKDWEELLNLTEPENWTAAAMYEATRIFASNLKCKMAERFYEVILLPRIRDEIAQCKRLSTHVYRAVEKAVFKPRAFVRGIIIPLCQSKTCTKDEASILTSVIHKTSIPVIQASFALLKICEVEKYSEPNCLFIRTLLEKKYALPFLAIDSVVDYFLRFSEVDETQPTLWHQCLKTFVEIYKHTLSRDQQQELLNSLRHQNHPKITVYIRKELLSSVSQSREVSINQ